MGSVQVDKAILPFNLVVVVVVVAVAAEKARAALAATAKKKVESHFSNAEIVTVRSHF